MRASVPAGLCPSCRRVRGALVQGPRSLNEAGVPTLPDLERLSPRMLGIDEHRFGQGHHYKD